MEYAKFQDCREKGCDAAVHARDRCQMHYRRWMRQDSGQPNCVEDGCIRAAVSFGLCQAHYAAARFEGIDKVCKVIGCDESVRVIDRLGPRSDGRVFAAQMIKLKSRLHTSEPLGLLTWCRSVPCGWSFRSVARPAPASAPSSYFVFLLGLASCFE